MVELIFFVICYSIFKIVASAFSEGRNAPPAKPPKEKTRGPRLQRYNDPSSEREGLIEWFTGNFH